MGIDGSSSSESCTRVTGKVWGSTQVEEQCLDGSSRKREKLENKDTGQNRRTATGRDTIVSVFRLQLDGSSRLEAENRRLCLTFAHNKRIAHACACV